MSSISPLVGIFIGGRSTRMGGAPKGLLEAPDGQGSLVARLVRESRAALGSEVSVVWVGEHPAYAGLGVASIADDPPGIGPMGGLHALLSSAQVQDRRHALAMACDLPRVTASMIQRLARVAPEAAAVAPKQAGRWQPLFARYSVEAALPIVRTLLGSRTFTLQQVFVELGPAAVELVLDAEELTALNDWDRPEDLADHD